MHKDASILTFAITIARTWHRTGLLVTNCNRKKEHKENSVLDHGSMDRVVMVQAVSGSVHENHCSGEEL